MLGCVLVFGCYLLLPPFKGSPLLSALVGLAPVLAIGYALRRYRPRPTAPWVFFIAAQLFVVAGDFVRVTFHPPFPSVADGLYVAFYLLQIVGLLLLIRARTGGRSSGGLIDAVIVASGFGLLSWVYLVDPYNSDAAVSELTRVFALAYPAMGVLVLGVVVRLGAGTGGPRPRAISLMTASILCLIATSAVSGAVHLGGREVAGGPLDLGWMAAYLLWAAAALHPSMRELSARLPMERVQLPGWHLALLGASTLVAPVLIVIDSVWPIRGFDVPGAAGAAAVAFLLLIFRMVGLVSSEREAVGQHAQAVRREVILRQAMTALTAASDRDAIREAAIRGARGLAGGLRRTEAVLEIGEGSAPAGAAPEASPQTVVVQLATLAAVYGRLIVTSADPIPDEIADGLETFGAQVALALEAVAFSERFNQQSRESWVGALVRNSTDMIFVVDARLVIRYATPSVQTALGHRPDDLVGESLLGLVEPEQEPALTAFLVPPLQRPGENNRAEWRLRRGDGGFTDVEVVSTDLLKNPTVNGIIVTAHDITDRKALEAGLKRQVLELQSIDRIRAEFVASVSHELRTPLTNIIGEAELLADGDLGELLERQTHAVEVISRNSERLLALIDDLLTLSHIEDSDLELHREPTPVAGLVHEVGNQVASAAVAKSVELILDCSPHAGTAYVDKEQMGRALLNLLTNAVKFTPAGGTVDFQARRDGDHLVVTVADTGVGIPLHEQAQLFSRFFRSASATRLAVQGTGLGLVIVKKIVEQHGGTISISSVPDVGTSVTVKVPAEPEPGPGVYAA